MSKIKLTKPTPADDAAINAGIAADPDTAELNDAQFAEAASMAHAKRGRGRPAAERTKALVSLRLDSDLLDALRGSGEGWQTRVNAVLRREYLGEGAETEARRLRSIVQDISDNMLSVTFEANRDFDDLVRNLELHMKSAVPANLAKWGQGSRAHATHVARLASMLGTDAIEQALQETSRHNKSAIGEWARRLGMEPETLDRAIQDPDRFEFPGQLRRAE